MSNPLEDVKLYKKVDVSAERVARVYAEALLNSAGDQAESLPFSYQWHHCHLDQGRVLS